MKEWLNGVKPPRFLRYLFFIVYSFYRRFISHRGDAHFTAIVFLALGPLFIYSSFAFFIPNLEGESHIILILIAIQFYFWFWHKEKWRSYIEEFKHISRKKQLIGGVYLFIYLFICLMFFFIHVIMDDIWWK